MFPLKIIKNKTRNRSISPKKIMKIIKRHEKYIEASIIFNKLTNMEIKKKKQNRK